MFVTSSSSFDSGQKVKPVVQNTETQKKSVETSKMSKAEKYIARYDKDNDGKLSVSELVNTKLGKKKTDAFFEKRDKNSDGMLDVNELSYKNRNPNSTAAREEAMRERYAAYLTEKVGKVDRSTDIAGRVMKALDGDGSGALNSEEIAGTRLAKMIGGDFYRLDADKNGALNKEELSSFVADYLISDAGKDKFSVKDKEDPAAPVLETADAEEVKATQKSEESKVSYVERVKNAFEAALKILQDSETTQSPTEIVEELYGSVSEILDGAPVS